MTCRELGDLAVDDRKGGIGRDNQPVQAILPDQAKHCIDLIDGSQFEWRDRGAYGLRRPADLRQHGRMIGMPGIDQHADPAQIREAWRAGIPDTCC